MVDVEAEEGSASAAVVAPPTLGVEQVII